MSGIDAVAVESRRDYWLCQLAGWGTLAVVGVLSSSFGDWESALRFAAAKTFCAVTGLGLSHLWHGHLKRHGWIDRAHGLPIAGIVGGLFALSLLQTGFLLLADLIFRRGQLFADSETLGLDIAVLVILWLIVFSVWTLLYAVALARRRALRFELEKLQLEVSVKDAELRALHAQVNPHFFFNSLNSIRALVYQDADAAARAINQLAGMMRHRLRSSGSLLVRLDDELQAVSAYLGMEHLRFEERLRLHIDVDPALGAALVPPMVLQTLVENAIKHGVERAAGECAVHVLAHREGARVRIDVGNQGTLAPSSSSTRMGLSNAAQRLALQFGAHATCTLSERDGWVHATLDLPYRTE